jgi:hypothetical protein
MELLDKTFEETMCEVMGGTLFIDKKFMKEVNTLFFERLNNDEKLNEIIRENDVDLEKVLFTNINYTYNDGGMDAVVSVMPELMKHLLKNDTINVNNVTMNLYSRFDKGDLVVNCQVKYDIRLVFPKEFKTSQGIGFEYKDVYGTAADNEIYDVSTNVRQLQATFNVKTPKEVVDILFEIMYNVLKEENK